MKFGAFVSATVLSALVVGCAPRLEPPAPPAPPAEKADTKPSKVQLRSIPYSALPGWVGDRHAEALSAFQKSCERLLVLPADRAVASNGAAPGGTVANWRQPCETAQALTGVDDFGARHFFETWFVAYEVMDAGVRDGLFTGYFEPELNGSWTRDEVFQTPLYARPDNLVSASLGAFDDDLGGSTIWGRVADGKLKPYAARAAIENGDVPGLQPLLWVDDPVDAFFLHIQGSGRVRMQDGTVAQLGFAGKNGLKYKSIGRVLIDSGEIPADRLTMDAIRKWVHARPEEGPALLKKNPSFVFFRLLDGDGPLGAQGVVLTPGRSLAVDRRYIPLGAPLWLTTHEPLDAKTPFQRLMVAQDTGGAIKGVVRGDIYFGSGTEAGKEAGNMKRPGRYYLLLPISVVPVQTPR